jgi:hypothetical protein
MVDRDPEDEAEDQGSASEAEFETSAPKGCCRVTSAAGTYRFPNITEQRCEERALELGGVPEWNEGPC